MRWFLLLVLTNMVFAQAAPANSKAAKPATSVDQEDEEQAPPPAPKIAPDTAVITIKGICDDKPRAATAPPKTAKPVSPRAECQTVVTRAQFEKLADALQPNMAPQVKRQLANSYPRILTMAHEARKRGLDKSPAFEEKLQFARQQLLMQELNRAIQAEAAVVPEKEIADYYHENSAAYEQATLQRIFVPKSKAVDSPKDSAKPDDVKSRQEAAEAAMTQEAEALRTRAVAGEDFEKLQKEAFDLAGLKSTPPPTNLGKMRRTNLPPAHASVFDLKPNQVAPVISDPSGHYIYRLVSKQIPPLDQVKEEIHATLQNQRMKDALQNIQNSTTSELNDTYFGASPAAPARGPGRPNQPAPNKEPPQAPAKPE
jgi:hypothetical protein